MARNEQRRLILLDAGLEVLAERGSRGLTHRAVDQRAELPAGTCGNYFATRDTLVDAMGERVFERLTPSAEELAESAARPASRARFKQLMHELMGRVMAAPHLQLALLELRLEATRRPALRERLGDTLRGAFEADVAFHERSHLPGGELEVRLLHLAIGGLILNTTTVPEVLEVQHYDKLLDVLVDRLVPRASR